MSCHRRLVLLGYFQLADLVAKTTSQLAGIVHYFEETRTSCMHENAFYSFRYTRLAIGADSVTLGGLVSTCDPSRRQECWQVAQNSRLALVCRIARTRSSIWSDRKLVIRSFDDFLLQRPRYDMMPSRIMLVTHASPFHHPK